MLASNQDLDNPEEVNRFGNYYMQNQYATMFLLNTLGFISLATTVFQSMQNMKEKIVSASLLIKKRDFEKVQPLLGWLPLEVVKCTFECTTQLAMEVGLGGVPCAQLFVGTESKLTQIFGMRAENEGPQAFHDFIRENGAPYALRSNNSKMQTGISFTNILRKYSIKSEHTKPNYPTQNPAERRIQDVKPLSAKILDWTRAPGYTWFFCMLYTVMLLNFTALESIRWITPHQACFGTTPDISALLQYQFFQPVYYSDKEAFPTSSEHLGHWFGVAKNKGDTLTYWVLADNKQ
eukprot:15046876-Ditylum_brightwellii.AAC.1